MYESRICFQFTIFIASLQQQGFSAPSSRQPAAFQSNDPQYGYGKQVSSSILVVTANNGSHVSNETSTSTYPAAANNHFVPMPHVQQSPYSLSASYQQATSTYPPNAPYSPLHTPIYSPLYPGSSSSDPSYQGYHARSYAIDAQSQQASQSHGMQLTTSFLPALHSSAYSPSQITHHAASNPLHFGYPRPLTSSYAGHPPVSSFAPPSSSLHYNTLHPPAFVPYNPPVAGYYPVPSYHVHDSSVTSTTRRPATPTTPRPTTTATPKPLELELSIEDFFYLSQLQQMFNKSLDKQGIDISSLTRPAKKHTEDKDESPVFYGGVLDLDELSKIENMNDLMKALKKVDTKTQVSRKDAETTSSEDEDGVEESHSSADRRRKGSHDPSRTKSHKKKSKKKKKESDRADHGNEDEEQEEAANEESDEESEETDDEKIGIGSTPSASQLDSRKKKQRIRTSLSTTTTASPLSVYHSPYLYSIPYNYPQLQQQYMQQLQALSGQLQTFARPVEKESAKFADEEPLTSPNENRNVINVNIADPRKVGENDKKDQTGNQETSSASRLPLRRGSFNSMANSLARKALTSILYRVFPTMKHINVKGVAARGCRDVQSIGSLDSIIMPLGLAVTLHPLLLPLVPFLLLALGSIKAIESATCFVSEYFT